MQKVFALLSKLLLSPIRLLSAEYGEIMSGMQLSHVQLAARACCETPDQRVALMVRDLDFTEVQGADIFAFEGGEEVETVFQDKLMLTHAGKSALI